jgi:imidazolonepropionase-like amidohydrolase
MYCVFENIMNAPNRKVGVNLPVPSGVQVVDARGKVVMPGK